eukprot:TRINITY_DN13666_c0_g1_i2.p1 TRINITY_DN13666_c0_g1~~TRINITY_DN13666_c0_g1_i2.p1  ORF type:complete len:175 (-),score=27.85 TRINITY_DN13666_c0_g1_i2:96-620(-)
MILMEIMEYSLISIIILSYVDEKLQPAFILRTNHHQNPLTQNLSHLPFRISNLFSFQLSPPPSHLSQQSLTLSLFPNPFSSHLLQPLPILTFYLHTIPSNPTKTTPVLSLFALQYSSHPSSTHFPKFFHQIRLSLTHHSFPILVPPDPFHLFLPQNYPFKTVLRSPSHWFFIVN